MCRMGTRHAQRVAVQGARHQRTPRPGFLRESGPWIVLLTEERSALRILAQEIPHGTFLQRNDQLVVLRSG